MKLEAVYLTLEHQNAADAIVEILNMPVLYEQLTHLFEIRQFESHETAEKEKEVEELLEKYAPAPL